MLLTDDEIKALAHKAGDGETGRREFSADVAWLLAFARSVETAERMACRDVVEECIRTQAHLASNAREALSEVSARLYKRGRA